MNLELWKSNSQILKIFGVKDESGNYANNKNIVGTLKDSKGVSITGLINVTFTYVNNSNGDYQYVVQKAFDPAPGTTYTLILDDSTDIHIEIPTTVSVRHG